MSQVMTVRLLNRQGLSKPLVVNCQTDDPSKPGRLVLIGWPDSEDLRIGIEQRSEALTKALPKTAPFIVTRLTWPEKKLRLLILRGQQTVTGERQ